MYLLQDSPRAVDRVIKIDESNLLEVQDTICLYHIDRTDQMTLVQSDAAVGIIKNNLKNVMGSAKLIETCVASTNSGNYGFGVDKIFLKRFFEKYKVKEIHPFHYVLKEFINDGLFAIASNPILLYKDFKPDLGFGAEANAYYSNPSYNLIGEHVTYDRDQRDVEEMLSLALNDSDVKRVKILAGFENLSIGVNYESVDLKDIAEILKKSQLKIVDKISDIYKQRQINAKLVLACFFLTVVTGAFTGFYFKNQLDVANYESKIADFSERNEALTKKIKEATEYLPKLNLSEFNIDAVNELLKKYTKYVPDKVKYVFKDANTITIDFVIKNAYFAEGLIKELKDHNIKFKYDKSTGYSFVFNIEEKIGNASASKAKKGERK